MNEPPQGPQPPPSGPQPGSIQPHFGGPAAPPPKTNGMSVASLVSGILGLTMCFGVGSVAALICGYIGRGQIKRSEGREGGNGMALAGIVMGWIGVVLAIVVIAAMALGAFALFNVASEVDVQEILDEGETIVLEESLQEIPLAEANCTAIETYRDMGADHIRVGQSHRPYNSNPPTSGPHYDLPADPLFYEPANAPDPEQLVHNLEHGQIVIWYRPHVDGLLESQVEELVAQEPMATVGAPLENMNEPYNVVLTAWTKARACEIPSQAVVDDFRRRFQGKGPEKIAPLFKG